jgi:hypothetical protein
LDLLRKSPNAVAAEEVARSMYMYVDKKNERKQAFGPHLMMHSKGAPTAVDIWHAQMSLWIQQDIATALARCNDQRVEELRRQGVEEPYWVIQMPVKRLVEMSIEDVLGDEGGGSNRFYFARSFTRVKNDDKMFVVPLIVTVVIEEAALADVVEKLCGVGFYTVTAMTYEAVEPDPLLMDYNQLYIYGETPVIKARIHLEGYYFREVFEPWIPESLKEDLKSPGGSKSRDRRGRRGERG